MAQIGPMAVLIPIWNSGGSRPGRHTKSPPTDMENRKMAQKGTKWDKKEKMPDLRTSFLKGISVPSFARTWKSMTTGLCFLISASPGGLFRRDCITPVSCEQVRLWLICGVLYLWRATTDVRPDMDAVSWEPTVPNRVVRRDQAWRANSWYSTKNPGLST